MPTSSAPSFKLILPGLMAAIRRTSERLPALERLLAYGSIERCSEADPDHECWQREFLSMLRIAEIGNYPSAALTRAGQRGEVVEGVWLHVDAARMDMYIDGLTVHASSGLSQERVAALSGRLRKHLAEEAIDFDVVDTSMYLHKQTKFDASTTSLQRADGRSLRDVLPVGPDAARLRRLMTEMQMLLQEVLGDSVATNAVWLWGQGSVTPGREMELPTLYTNENFAKGVYLLHYQKKQCRPQPLAFDAVESKSGDCAAVIRLDDSIPLRDIEDRWFGPALRALHRGDIGRIELGMDGVAVRAERSLWKRMTVRPRAIGEVLV